MMNGTPALPAWPDEHLAGLSLEQLVDLLIRDEDRAPRNVIDHCAARGEEMVAQLRAALDSDHAWRSEVSPALRRRGRRPHGKRARQLYILQGFPGIGPERAHQLLARFGSVEAIARAPAEDLRSVEGIGERIAGALRWSVEESRCNYRPG